MMVKERKKRVGLTLMLKRMREAIMRAVRMAQRV